jgi:hypothetical protein
MGWDRYMLSNTFVKQFKAIVAIHLLREHLNIRQVYYASSETA